VADRKPFLLRLNPDVLDAVRRWADDDLRSLNAQIEFLLRRSLLEAGRLRRAEPSKASRPRRPSAKEGGA
jgi:hypothetical protein